MNLLLVGGDDSTAAVIEAAASRSGTGIRRESRISDALRAIVEGGWAATIVSLDVPGVDLPLVGRIAGELRAGVVFVTARDRSVALALGAARVGARGFLREPMTEKEAGDLLDSVMGSGPRLQIPEDAGEVGSVVGRSSRLLAVFEEVGRVAGSGATVLIGGESGTGKEMVARTLHDASARSARPFVAVNCAAIPEDLLESELFGHERGAFTGAVARKIGRFERAHTGTLFLDEIGDMSLVLQAKILRALQEREIERLGGEERIKVDVRIVAATHRDMGELVSSGAFRDDLYYRLAVVRLHLPPLRDRVEDLRELMMHYAKLFAEEHGRPIRFIARAALERLEAHPWPGNVRELRNVVERAILVAPGDTIGEGHLALDPPRHSAPKGDSLVGYRADMTLSEVEAIHIARVLDDAEGQVGRAAEILGIHRNTVSRKAAEHGIRTG